MKFQMAFEFFFFFLAAHYVMVVKSCTTNCLSRRLVHLNQMGNKYLSLLFYITFLPFENWLQFAMIIIIMPLMRW